MGIFTGREKAEQSIAGDPFVLEGLAVPGEIREWNVVIFWAQDACRLPGSLDQNTQRQLEGIQLDRIFTDKASGKDTKRPQREELLRFIRDGDTLVVHSMDRLARNLDDLRSLVQKLTKKGVRVEFLKEHLVFTGEESSWQA